MAIKFTSVEQYIASFPASTQAKLEEIRAIIIKAAPHAEEVISYNMPAIKQGGILVYYAAYAKHIGFYPTASGIANFKADFGKYEWSKGAVQFPITEKMPRTLISNMVKFRVAEVTEKAKAKKAK